MSQLSFGEFLKTTRIKRKMNINQLAEASGISNAQISRIENGVRGVPKPETIERLSEALNVSYVEMMVVAGYWDEDELLEPINNSNEINETPSRYKNEKEFARKLELSDEDILKEFDLELDGKKLTEIEAKGIIAYIRSLRQVDR